MHHIGSTTALEASTVNLRNALWAGGSQKPSRNISDTHTQNTGQGATVEGLIVTSLIRKIRKCI